MAVKLLEELEGKFKYEIDEANNMLHIEAAGSYSEEESVLAFQAYNRVVAQCDPSKLTVLLKFADIDYVDEEREGILLQLFQLYLNTGFVEVHLEAPALFAAQLQLEEAIVAAGLNVKIVK